jgi:glutathione S-transferase
MLVVHHLNNSRSQRILWLLEELAVPYKIKHYQRDAQTMLAPPELKAIHPLGKSPVVTDGEVVIAETGAIVDYIVGKYGGGRLAPPAGSPERLTYDYWLHYAEGSAMPPLLLALVFGVLPERAPFFVRPIVRGITAAAMKGFIQPQLDLHIGYWESVLDKTPWFAGQEMTAADIMMSFPVEAAASRGGLDKRYPRLQQFLTRIHGREAYKRALEKGGPYVYAQ